MNNTKKQSNFGFRKVEEGLKSSLVGEVFSSVANKYDLMNDVMSLGLHRAWKHKLISNIKLKENTSLIDMAGGTGDISLGVFKKYKDLVKDFSLTIADFNKEMIEQGKAQALDKNIIDDRIKWQIDNGEKSKFKDQSFDIYVITYGIRNFADIKQGLKEAYRILKPGGKFLCLEFSQVKNELLKQIYDFYSFQIIPKLGGLLTGDQDSYQYFVESIRTFPSPGNFTQMIKDTGFKDTSFENLSFGITTLYTAEKPS